jgi:hypothetical protein
MTVLNQTSVEKSQKRILRTTKTLIRGALLLASAPPSKTSPPDSIPGNLAPRTSQPECLLECRVKSDKCRKEPEEDIENDLEDMFASICQIREEGGRKFKNIKEEEHNVNNDNLYYRPKITQANKMDENTHTYFSWA